MGKHSLPTIITVIGITGDLSRRKLLPAILDLARADMLPEKFRIIGVSRKPIDISSLLADIDEADGKFLERHIERVSFDLADTSQYRVLADKVSGIEEQFGEQAEHLVYLSVPPEISKLIVKHLGESDVLVREGIKLLLEKPFGTNELSATELVRHVDAYFTPEQVYRIDHYLAKEMAQNILVFRRDNSLFKNTWNKQFIESIEIVASEKIGVEQRSNFYEQTGALRDLVQSHLLQLTALVLMSLPHHNDPTEVPRARLAALSALQPAAPEHSRRAQYTGYSTEVDNPSSLVETFTSLTLFSNDPTWEGVPIRIATGKALSAKYTEVRINYRKTAEHESNELILRLQPNEGVTVIICVKEPGFDGRIERKSLQFNYDQETKLPDAYERVLLDAMRSDHSLFATSEEVLASWHIIQPLLDAWAFDKDIEQYEVGTALETLM